MKLKKPPFIASLFLILGLVILGTLATWQWNKYFLRMGEFNNCSKSELPVLNSSFDDLQNNMANSCSVIVYGRIKDSPRISLSMKTSHGQVGYETLAVLEGSDGSLILVNLGWSQDIDPSVDLSKINSVAGLIIKPRPAGKFSPKNQPEKDLWFVTNLEDIKGNYDMGNELSDYVLYAQEMFDQDKQALSGFESASVPKSYLQPQTHLQYALFWSAMACILIIIFVLRFIVIFSKQ